MQAEQDPLDMARCLCRGLPQPALLAFRPGGTVLLNEPLARLLGHAATTEGDGERLLGGLWPDFPARLDAATASGQPLRLAPNPGGLELPFRCTVVGVDGGASVVLAAADLDAGRVMSEAAAAVERAMAAKARFLATASHDLRQPFQAMRLFLGALLGQLKEERSLKIAQQLGAAMEAGDTLLNALLDISTLDAGTVTPKPVEVALPELLRSVVEEFRPQAEEKGLELRLRLGPGAVYSDPLLLSRVLRNLLANAIHYTRRGKVLVALRPRRGALSIEIWDTGFGIPGDQQTVIFEEFTQLENPARQQGKGLGLGLAIVRRLAQLLDITIELRSQLGRGSVFRLLLPAAAPPAPRRKARTEAGDAPPGLDGITVLVVDDNPMVLEALDITLQSWGCRVLTAAGMAEVMQAVERVPDGPDVLLSDLRLPGGVTGFDVIDRVNRIFRRTIPSIVLTGETGRQPLLEGERRGIEFLHKPLNPTGIRAAIGRVLGRPR